MPKFSIPLTSTQGKPMALAQQKLSFDGLFVWHNLSFSSVNLPLRRRPNFSDVTALISPGTRTLQDFVVRLITSLWSALADSISVNGRAAPTYHGSDGSTFLATRNAADDCAGSSASGSG